jgi:hypothetical protein
MSKPDDLKHGRRLDSFRNANGPPIAIPVSSLQEIGGLAVLWRIEEWRGGPKRPHCGRRSKI